MPVELSEADRARLSGTHGEAAALAMRIVVETAGVMGAALLSAIFLMRERARTAAENQELRGRIADLNAALQRTDALLNLRDQRVLAWAGVALSPAVGAIIPGYETARHLHAKAMFVEREGGVFQLRRGFAIKPGERVLMVEDVVTTGLSSRECLDAIRGRYGYASVVCGKSLHLLGKLDQDDHGFILRTASLTK